MIRIATEKDLAQMLAIYTPYVENTTYSFEYVPPTLEQFAQRFRKYTAQCPWLVWEEKQRMWCVQCGGTSPQWRLIRISFVWQSASD